MVPPTVKQPGVIISATQLSDNDDAKMPDQEPVREPLASFIAKAAEVGIPFGPAIQGVDKLYSVTVWKSTSFLDI